MKNLNRSKTITLILIMALIIVTGKFLINNDQNADSKEDLEIPIDDNQAVSNPDTNAYVDEYQTPSIEREDIGYDIESFGKRHPELEQALLDVLANTSGESFLFSKETAGYLNGVAVSEEGIAVIDFKDFSYIIPNASTSAGKAELYRSLNPVIFQYKEINQVYYQFDGSHSKWAYWLEIVEGPVSRDNN